jgi:peptide/nickel transport system permease protein
MVFVTFVVSIILFVIYRSVPADPVLLQIQGLQGDMTPAEFQVLYDMTLIELGLDRPLYVQYTRWAGRMVQLDFGRSMIHRRPVMEVVAPRIRNTLRLNIVQLVIVFCIVIPLGVSTAVRKGSAYDNTIQVVTILGFSLPTFILALIAILIFASILGITPVSGTVTPGLEILGASPFRLFLDRAHHMVLPVGTMVFASLAGLTRYVRTTMIDALRMDYIRTARAKGLREKVVIYSHAFRNSLVPFVTIMVGWFISLFSGSLMIETIFGWNGMGLLFFNSISAFDYSVVMALSSFYVVLGLVGFLVVDLLYVLVDPRMRVT